MFLLFRSISALLLQEYREAAEAYSPVFKTNREEVLGEKYCHEC